MTFQVEFQEFHKLVLIYSDVAHDYVQKKMFIQNQKDCIISLVVVKVAAELV